MKFKDLDKLLRKHGYQLIYSNKHHKYYNGITTVMVPTKREINRMLSIRILKMAGIDVMALNLF
jgi:hypothetical protein